MVIHSVTRYNCITQNSIIHISSQFIHYIFVVVCLTLIVNRIQHHKASVDHCTPVIEESKAEGSQVCGQPGLYGESLSSKPHHQQQQQQKPSRLCLSDSRLSGTLPLEC